MSDPLAGTTGGTDFLLELLSEEIPARMQEKARDDLARLFAAEIAKAGLVADAIETHATPRRLALIARGLPAATAAIRQETKGPKAGAPPQALEGFLRKTGLSREQLVERDGVLFAIVEQPGRATAQVLGEAMPAIVRTFPWPKSMRWGGASASTASLRWVRPLHGIVALFGEEIVPCAVEGIVAGAATRGHRFHHPDAVTIGSVADYALKLRACHVILDADERRAIIRDGAAAQAAARGLAVIADEGLVAENAGLTEWPVPLIGDFDPAFLEVPREVIQLTMRTNQKYFACTDAEGRLAPAFICTANIAASDGGAGIVAGNRKVLAARLADAKFFWEQDLKVPLEEQAKKLDRIVFHEKLGTVADKVARVANLARWLVEEGIVGRDEPDRAALADMAEQAARLCKADLVTGMVGEFPELQGVMGGYYARAEGLPDAVADAIRDHYKPVGQGDEVPTAPVTVAVSLADKLDSVFSFFAIQEPPSGSRDPFALRRSMLGMIRILDASKMRLGLNRAMLASGTNYAAQYAFTMARHVPGLYFSTENVLANNPLADGRTLRSLIEVAVAAQNAIMSSYDASDQAWNDQQRQIGWAHRDYLSTQLYIDDECQASDTGEKILSFAADRLKVQQREAGVRHDLIDAVFALGGEDDLVRLLARVKALQAFVATEDGANLLAGYKRAANILRKEGYDAAPVAPAEAGVQMRDTDRGGAGILESGFRRNDGQEGAEAGHRPEPAHFPLSYTPEKAEADLLAALDSAEDRAGAAVADERFEDAMTALAALRAPIDAFFDRVTVNDPDPARREGRLAMLARVRGACHAVADFSRIEG